MDWNNSMKPFTSPSDASSAFYLDNVRDNYSSVEKFKKDFIFNYYPGS